MIKSIAYKGFLVENCALAGEGRETWTAPAQSNAIQLSVDRWLIAFSTRSIRGVDDDKSIVYQIRKDKINGPLVKEDWVVRFTNDWEPFGDGRRFVMQHGCVVLFGVPMGAKINGETPAHHNRFVMMWRKVARYLNPETGVLESAGDAEIPGLVEDEFKTQTVEWVQFRYNPEDDDIEFTQNRKRLCQRGYEHERDTCSLKGTEHLNRVFVNPIAYDDECSEWVDLVYPKDIVHGKPSWRGVIPITFRYDSKTQLYQWIDHGPLIRGPKGKTLWEGAIARCGDQFVITPRVTAKNDYALAFAKTTDPFARGFEPVFKPWSSNVPLTCYQCADGETRLFTGNRELSPNGSGRNPIYTWTINDDFSLTDRHVVVDPVKENILPGEAPKNLCVDFPKLVDHAGGDKQTVIFRFKTFNLAYKRGEGARGEPMNQEQLAACGVHYAEITYDRSYPARWIF